MAIALIGMIANVVMVPEGLQEALITKIPTAKMHIVAVDAIIAIQIMVAFPTEKWYNENNKIFQEGRLYGRIRPFSL
jgi:hypothetical protein